ncbi:DNA internalization-related competence protein ComEC/Rec2 [Vibrio ponticus]|nr:DNA internalization-related competence protein ComEC/Rec2 [Vibrio ponticus]
MNFLGIGDMTLFINYWTLSSFAILIITTPYWTRMPEWFWSVPCLIGLLLCFKFRWLRWGCGVMAALFLVTVSLNQLHHQMNTLFSAGSDFTINAEVDSLFKPINRGFQGVVTIKRINGKELDYFSRPKIYLTTPFVLELDDQVTARIKLKPIVGVLNQVGFDREKYAISQRVIASGVIKTKSAIMVRSYGSIRQSLFSRALLLTHSYANQGLLIALGFGERAYLSPQTWQQLQQSGLSHLVAISGLHIGVAFGFAWWVAFQFSRAGVTQVWLPPLCGMLLAVGYAWLAGFSITTQRALILLLILLVLRTLQIHTSYRFKWLLMVTGLLFYDPFAVYSHSFYLSIFAVAVVFFIISTASSVQAKWRQVIISQIVLILLMSPIIAIMFNGLSLASMGYNLLFVPWFSFWVIPLILAAVLLLPFFERFPTFSQALFELADLSLLPVMKAAEYSHLGWLIISSQSAIFLLCAVCLVLLYRFLRPQMVVVGLMMLVMIAAIPRYRDVWQVNILDVGHGLAVVISRGQRAILYDTGAGWKDGSYAKSVVVPFLNSQGLQLDRIVISHFDSDHAGGLRSLLNLYPDVELITSQHFIHPQFSSSQCVSGRVWLWQQLNFEVLWPPQLVKRAYNPHSCVVRVSDQVSGQSLLLTGDVESIAEWTLVRQPESLASDVVIVPHHGSKSSSLAQFVSAVDAEVAIASTAYLGRWKLPNKEVKTRYQQHGSEWLDTGSSGQVTVEYLGVISDHGIRVSTMRRLKGQAWYRQMLRKRVE